jgi:hypothetical protein
MSSKLNFDNKVLYNKLNEHFGVNLKITLKFYNRILIITKSDLFYEIDINDANIPSYVLTNDNSIIESMINKTLCSKGIIDLIPGWNEYITRTIDNNIYFENGINNIGINEVFSDLNIDAIKCGEKHTLVLTSSGEIYSWGDNEYGQVGSDDYEDQLIPVKLDCFNNEKVVMISCGVWHSMALTECGHVFSWGYNNSGQLGHGNTTSSYTPKQIELEGIIIDKISCGAEHSLLLSDGVIYAFGDNYWGQLGNGKTENQLIPVKLEYENKFIDIAAHFSLNISVSLSVDNIYYVWGECDEENILIPINTNFNSFNEVFLSYFSIQYESSDKLIEFEDYLFRFGFYNNEFEEIEELGGGSFGTVFKVKDRWNEFFAVKKVDLKVKMETEFLREFISYSVANRLEKEFIVKHYIAWFENVEMLTNKKLTLFIKMELCDKTLEQIIDEIQSDSNFRKDDILTPIGYYIASLLFIEILKGVQYLHENNIIHRDLKPLNILLKKDKNYKSFIKIADFGLLVLHKFSEQSHTIDKGTPKYMAPEVISNKKYDFKADIYSLGIIFEQLIDLDVTRLAIHIYFFKLY